MSPFVKSLPSYIKDTNHALKTFRDFNFPGQNKLIFTMDITSLYTVIPNHEGLLALKYFFDQRANKEPSPETLIRLAELVLTLNCFSFSDNYYKQINGVAMGTKMGPSYANLLSASSNNNFSTNLTALNRNSTAATSTTALAQHLAADKNLTTSLHRLILFIRL